MDSTKKTNRGLDLYDYQMIVFYYIIVDNAYPDWDNKWSETINGEKWISYKSLVRRLKVKKNWLNWVGLFSVSELEEVLRRCTGKEYAVETYCDMQKISEEEDYNEFEYTGIIIRRKEA